MQEEGEGEPPVRYQVYTRYEAVLFSPLTKKKCITGVVEEEYQAHYYSKTLLERLMIKQHNPLLFSIVVSRSSSQQ